METGKFSYSVSQCKDGSWRMTVSTPKGKHFSLGGYASSKGAESAAKKTIGNMSLYSGGWRPWDQKKEPTPVCPDCGAPMIRRDGKYGPFWGCSKWPKCRGALRI